MLHPETFPLFLVLLPPLLIIILRNQKVPQIQGTGNSFYNCSGLVCCHPAFTKSAHNTSAGLGDTSSSWNKKEKCFFADVGCQYASRNKATKTTAGGVAL